LNCQAKGYPEVQTKWIKKVFEEGKVKTFNLMIIFFIIIIFIFKTGIKEFQSSRIEFNLTKEMAGEYICISQNSQGKDEKSIFVNYYGKYLK
jgi:hypothetical protein